MTKATPDTKEKHMARRKAAGLSLRKVADEFGTSKSTAHRKVKAALAQGYTRMGRA